MIFVGASKMVNAMFICLLVEGLNAISEQAPNVSMGY